MPRRNFFLKEVIKIKRTRRDIANVDDREEINLQNDEHVDSIDLEGVD